MAVRHGYGKVVTDGLVFAYDTGDTKNSYLGAPMFNASREVHDWPTKARATVTEYTGGDIEPPFPGAKISKAVCTSTTTGILLRDGGYYYGGGFAGTGNPQNTDLLSDRTNSYTPVGDNKFTFVVYAKSGPDTDANTTVGIDIGDKNVVNVTNLENYDDWVRLETDDSGGINSQYPYDFFDISFSNTSIGNTIYLSAPMIIRTLGTDSGSLGTPPANIQYLPPKASRSVSGSLLDLTNNNTLLTTNNAGYDSNAQIVYDGTNDYIYTKTTPSFFNRNSSDTSFSNGASYEFVVKALGTGYFAGVGTAWRISAGTNNFTFWDRDISAGTSVTTTGIGNLSVTNNYVHVVGVLDPINNQKRFYINGEEELNISYDRTPSMGTTQLALGKSYPGSDNYCNCELPVGRVYTKALTAGEVKQNFAMYKKRFNI